MERMSAARTGTFRLMRWAALPIIFMFQGCGYTTVSYLKPTPVDFQLSRDAKPFHEDECDRYPDKVNVPLDAAVSMEIQAVPYVYRGGKDYSYVPGVTLYGEVHLPPGNMARFVNATVTVTDGTDHQLLGTIGAITRIVYYHAPKPTAGTSSFTLTFTPNDTLTGWTAEEARLSTPAPSGSSVDGDLQNFFRFTVPVENVGDPEFTARMPDMLVNGQPVPGRLISFKHIQFKRFATFLEGFCS